MKIGIISDTHDNVPMIRKAVNFFTQEGVEFIFHAGDYIAPFSLDPLLDFKGEWLGVFGNNDGEVSILTSKSENRIKFPPFEYEIDGKKVLLMHELTLLDTFISSRRYSLIIYGHTHEAKIEREGDVWVINPGECGGWVGGKSSIATFDLEEGEPEVILL